MKRVQMSVIIAVFILAGCTTPKPPRNGVLIDIDALVSTPVSRNAIMKKLGPPSMRLEQGGILTYRIAHRTGFKGHYVVPGDQQEEWVDPEFYDKAFREHGAWNEYSLVLVFDAQGMLQTYSLVEVYKKYDDA